MFGYRRTRKPMLSHLVERLLKDPNNFVIGIDNFSTGNNKFIEDAKKYQSYEKEKNDLVSFLKSLTDSSFIEDYL